MARSVGDLGENCFNKWCIEEGVACNKAAIDKTGTDFFVEFPFDPLDATPDALHRPALECKVQVKATDKKTGQGRVQVKLSNLRRMATAPLPTFIVVMEYGGENDPVACYVVHVDESLIEMVLKELHLLKVEGQDQALIRKKISIKYGDGMRLDSLSGKAVVDCFRYHIGADLAAYVEKKKVLLRTLGFKNGGVGVSFRTGGRDLFIKMMDVTLGLSDKVEVLDLKGFRKRFEIADKMPFLDMPKAIVSMPDLQPSSVGIARFRKTPLSPPIEMEAKVYKSCLNAIALKEDVKVRIVIGGIEFLLRPYVGKLDVKIQFLKEEETDLYRMLDFLKVIELLHKTDGFFNFEYETDDGGSFAVELRGAQIDVDCHELKSLVEDALLIADFFEVARSVRVSWNNLLDWEDLVRGFASILAPKKVEFGAVYKVFGGSYDGSLRTICAVPHFVRLGNYLLGVVIELEGIPRPAAESAFELDVQCVRMEHKFVWNSELNLEKDRVEKEMEVVAGKYKDNDGVCFVSMLSAEESGGDCPVPLPVGTNS